MTLVTVYVLVESSHDRHDRHGRTNRATEDLQPPRKSCECLLSPHSRRSSVAQLARPWRSKENQRKSPILIFADFC